MSGKHDDHDHSHGHGGAGGHSHGLSADADSRWLTLALVIIAAFMGVEVVAGIMASSLALLSDAAHMLTDAASLALALFAARLALKPPSGRYTFGFGRAEILAAQLNGASLFVLAGVIAVEAIRRLSDPPEVTGWLVIVVGTLGAVVNVAAAWALSRSQRRSLNVEGAMAHVMADLYGSLAAVTSGLVIYFTGFLAADALASLAVVALMLRTGWALLRDSGRVLLEGVPRGMDAQEVGGALAAYPGVVEVHDMHLWEVTSGFAALSAHVLVQESNDCHACRRDLEGMLRERFGVEHTTLQVDHQPRRQLLQIDSTPSTAT